MIYAEIYVMTPTLEVLECQPPCKDFPRCHHNEWTAECPKCGSKSYADYVYGPYTCGDCGHVYAVSVQGWVAGEGVDLDGWRKETSEAEEDETD